MVKSWNKPAPKLPDAWVVEIMDELDRGRGTAVEVREALEKILKRLREES